jgi:hypothetical protein
MGSAEGVGELEPEIEGLGNRKRPELKAPVEGLAVDELHGEQINIPAGRRHPVDVKDGDDVGVVEGRSGLGLPHEALPPVGVADGLVGEDLEGHQALKPGVEGAVDHAHSAGAHLLPDPIA